MRVQLWILTKSEHSQRSLPMQLRLSKQRANRLGLIDRHKSLLSCQFPNLGNYEQQPIRKMRLFSKLCSGWQLNYLHRNGLYVHINSRLQHW